MPSSEPVDVYCSTHDLFGCPFCHGDRSNNILVVGEPGTGVVAMNQVAPYPADFTNVVQALDAAHYPADDPVRRQIGAFDFPNIPDEEEAGYDRRA